jgi:predicted RNA-binding Zn-ribbon protein involved in translation (DUF1610 family)
MLEDRIKCPNCGSSQITAQKKGFSIGRAAAGAILTGGIGLAAGAIGKNKIIITCLNCGENFKPGEQLDHNDSESVKFVSKEGVSEPKLIWDDVRKTYVRNPKYKETRIPSLMLISCLIILLLLLFFIFQS